MDAFGTCENLKLVLVNKRFTTRLKVTTLTVELKQKKGKQEEEENCLLQASSSTNEI
jgi:hypothetical protein